MKLFTFMLKMNGAQLFYLYVNTLEKDRMLICPLDYTQPEVAKYLDCQVVEYWIQPIDPNGDMNVGHLCVRINNLPKFKKTKLDLEV